MQKLPSTYIEISNSQDQFYLLPFFHFQRFSEKGRLSMSYLFSTCALVSGRGGGIPGLALWGGRGLAAAPPLQNPGSIVIYNFFQLKRTHYSNLSSEKTEVVVPICLATWHRELLTGITVSQSFHKIIFSHTSCTKNHALEVLASKRACL